MDNSAHAPIAEYAIVYSRADVLAQSPGEPKPREISAGTAGTVVLVHYAGSSVSAYEVEFPLGRGNGALATIPEAQVELAPENHRRVCPCCGNRTLTDICPGSFEICPVCFWEDDLVQFENQAQGGGANRVSLCQARENYAAFGACEREALPYVRKPLASEAAARE